MSAPALEVRPDVGPGAGVRRLHEVFEASCDRAPTRTAVECGDRLLTYGELDVLANRLAHRLRARGVRDGSRVAILLPRSAQSYAALLTVSKAGAAFVPIGPGAPQERVAFIAGDAGAEVLISGAERAAAAAAAPCPVLDMDREENAIPAASGTRPEPLPDAAADPLAHVMYTSGSSGRPKGVESAQSSIVNFLSIVPRIYDVRPDDRVLQGMTISFDFSIEESWPTWAVGATLVAGPDGPGRPSAELGDFLTVHRISVLYCVPTLLRDGPGLRGIFAGGEACPAPLVDRWARPGRRMLNAYGPTEATVTATWAELRPGRPVTIGRPLPTYSVVLLDERREPVPPGEIGEICIGGPGVARGYVGRPDLTADRLVPHPLAPPPGRLYRTGDLGRSTPTGEIEYLGRADAEVKIRGHRVDLGEIDNVLLELPGVAEAVAGLAPSPGGTGRELAAYVVARGAADDLLDRTAENRRRRLPGDMVPTWLDVVPALRPCRGSVPGNRVWRRCNPAPAPTPSVPTSVGPAPPPRRGIRRFQQFRYAPKSSTSCPGVKHADRGTGP